MYPQFSDTQHICMVREDLNFIACLFVVVVVAAADGGLVVVVRYCRVEKKRK